MTGRSPAGIEFRSQGPDTDIRIMSDDPPLSAAELERYARHIVLAEVGGPGQQAFKAARVLVIGAGGT